MMPNDTSPDAHRVYWERLIGMTPSERTRLAAALCDAADRLQRAAIRRDYPEASEQEIAYRLAVKRYGVELARKAYGRS